MKCFGFSLYFQFLFHLFILIMIIPVTTVTHSTVLSHVILSYHLVLKVLLNTNQPSVLIIVARFATS